MRAIIYGITAAAVMALSTPAVAEDANTHDDVERVGNQLVTAVRGGDESSAEYATCYQIQADRHNARLSLMGIVPAVNARSEYHLKLAKQLAPLTLSDSTLGFDHGEMAGTDGDESLGNAGASQRIVLAGNIGVSGNRGSVVIPAVQLQSGRWCLLPTSL